MKRLFIIIFIIYSNCSVFGQSPCEEMNKDYDAYLTTHTNLLDTNDHFKLQEVAKCFLSKNIVKKKQWLTDNSNSYTIPLEIFEKDPVLLFLIMNARSMEKEEAKQGWFNLYPLLTDKQIITLCHILIYEKIKLIEIELKYDEKKLEIKKKYLEKWTKMAEAKKRSFSTIILGYDKKQNRLSTYEYKDKLFRDIVPNSEGMENFNFDCTFENMILVESIDDIKKYPELKHLDKRVIENEYKDFTELLVGQMIDSIEVVDNQLKQDFGKAKDPINKLKQYYLRHWGVLIQRLEKDRNNMHQYEKLLTLQFENFAIEKRVQDSFYFKKLWSKYTYYFNTRNYQGACFCLAELIQKKQYQLNSPHRFAMALYDRVIFSQDNNCHTCDETVNVFIEQRLQSSQTEMFEKVRESNYINFETHFYLLDFAKRYGDKKSIIIANILKDSVMKYVQESSLKNDNFFQNKWYKNLYDFYFNGKFMEIKDLSQINKDAIAIAKQIDIRKHEDIEALRMEYLCYYSLHQIIYNPRYNQKYLIAILNEVIRLGEQPSLPTYSYIEKHIASHLLKSVTEENVDQECPQVITIGVPSETYEPVVTLKGAATDPSGIRSLQISDETVTVKDNYFEKEQQLQVGMNKIIIRAEDNKGNACNKEITIKRKQVEDPFAARTDYVLIFATDEYQSESWKKLDNPIFDATELGAELAKSYGFKVEIVKNPTKEEVLLKLFEYTERTYNPYDQILVFFTGHGDYESKLRKGYLVFTDSKDKGNDYTRNTYMSYDDLKPNIDNIQCNHIFLMVDACHSGTLDRATALNLSRVSQRIHAKGDNEETEIKGAKEFLKAKLAFKSRPFMTSVSTHLSSDGEKGKHSPFIRGILAALRTYGGKDGILTFEELISSIQTINTSAEGKDYANYGRFADEEPGSSFFFIKK
jgi:Caspase domain